MSDYESSMSSSSSSSQPAATGAAAWRQWALQTEAGLSVVGGLGVLALGALLGFTVAPGVTYAEPWRHLSNVIGWTYFTAWSVSFWPQVFINARRRSVVGLSFDFVALNLLGFSCYSAYNCAYYWSPSVRTQYLARYGSLPGVQANDVFFGLHAVAVTLVTVVQMCVYERGQQTVTRYGIFLLSSVSLAAVAAGALAAAGTIDTLTCLLTLSYLKLVISLTKYLPQALLNFQRKSTVGWSIHNVLLDFVGGSLSVAQLAMDCSITGDWSGAIGDPVKFGLGFASMVFDVVFMTQHYVLYRGARDEDDAGGEYSKVDAGGEGLLLA